MVTIQTERLPLLENGYQLSQPEFHRRYEASPELEHVQLIEGIVYMPSPVRFVQHGEPQSDVVAWLKVYVTQNQATRAAGPVTIILDGENELEPDAVLLYRPDANGQAEIREDGYIHGAPELVVEISASTHSIDFGPKLRAYRRNGVREYIVWSTSDRVLTWYALTDGEYVPLQPDERGVIHSRVFPGLRLALDSLLGGDFAKVLAEQQSTTPA